MDDFKEYDDELIDRNESVSVEECEPDLDEKNVTEANQPTLMVSNFEETKNSSQAFYTEHKKNKRGGGKFGVFVLVLCLVGLSTGVGYSIGTLIGASGAMGGAVNFLEASGNIKYEGSAVSPGVEIAKKVAPAVVSMQVQGASQTFFGQAYPSNSVGSGVIFSEDGYIVTNNHVVEGANAIKVTMADGTEYPATIIGRDVQTDLAVVKIDGKDLPFAVFGDSTKLQVGELAIAIGTPMGTNFPGSVTQGIISGLNRKISVNDKGMSLIQTDAAINQGNSGGALVNANGEVIGINSSKLVATETEGMGFAIPISEAKPIIEQLITQKKISRPYLGIQGGTVTKEDIEKYQVPAGVYVSGVIPGKGAEKAGIVPGDIITSVAGEKVSTIEELQAEIAKHKVGDKVEVNVFGTLNRERKVTIVLEEVQD